MFDDTSLKVILDPMVTVVTTIAVIVVQLVRRVKPDLQVRIKH